MTDILVRLKGVRKTRKGWTARCPAHSDQQNSLSVAHREGRWLLKCHAGCKVEDITKALGIGLPDLFDNKRRGRGRPFNPSSNRATAQPSGLTLDAYAVAKHLPVEFLRGCGLSDVSYQGRTAVRIPYLGPTGELLATRFRIALKGDRFRWKAGSKPQLYGLNRLDEARDAGQVVLVEGESDAHTFWQHGIPALGVPGAANWREDRDAHHLDSIQKIYIVIEPDRGGEAVRKWVSQSAIRDRALLVNSTVLFPLLLRGPVPAANPT
jgi:putative DNA primase/helicase